MLHSLLCLSRTDAFDRIARRAGIIRPCLHDFRHTFAVRALETCQAERKKSPATCSPWTRIWIISNIDPLSRPNFMGVLGEILSFTGGGRSDVSVRGLSAGRRLRTMMLPACAGGRGDAAGFDRPCPPRRRRNLPADRGGRFRGRRPAVHIISPYHLFIPSLLFSLALAASSNFRLKSIALSGPNSAFSPLGHVRGPPTDAKRSRWLICRRRKSLARRRPRAWDSFDTARSQSPGHWAGVETQTPSDDPLQWCMSQHSGHRAGIKTVPETKPPGRH